MQVPSELAPRFAKRIDINHLHITTAHSGARISMRIRNFWHCVLQRRTPTTILLLTFAFCSNHFVFAETPRVRPERPPKPISLKGGYGDLHSPFLKKLIHVNFDDEPLTDVVVCLSNLTGVTIQLDERAVEESGLLPQHPITFSTE